MYGVLQDNVLVYEMKGKIYRKPYLPSDEFKFFYGVPELGTNLVWKPTDTNPSLALNFYLKQIENLSSVVAIIRYKCEGFC